MNMMRNLGVSAAAAVFTMVAAVAGAQTIDPTADVGNVRFVSGPTGGTYFPLGEGVARTMNQNSKGARVSSTPTGGSTENVRLISLGEADFGWAAADVVYYAHNGGREFPEALTNIRSVSAGHSSAGHLAVRADSDIASPEDLRGKKIAVGAAGSSNAQAALEWLKTYGIEEADVNLLYISTSATIDALRDNTIDAGFQLSGIPSSSWQALASDHPIRFLAISDEKMRELNERLPFFQAEVVPAGTYPGQDEDVQTIGVKVILVTREDVPAIQAYEMARTLVENNEGLVSAHPNGAMWDGRNVKDASFIPFHAGAAAYYESAGIEYKN